jgi:hypothetical protein
VDASCSLPDDGVLALEHAVNEARIAARMSD